MGAQTAKKGILLVEHLDVLRMGMEPHHGPTAARTCVLRKCNGYDPPAEGANMRPRSGRSE